MCPEADHLASREPQAIFSMIKHIGRGPPAEAGLRTMNWRLCFEGLRGERTARYARKVPRRRISGQERAMIPTTRMVPTPPTTTAGIGPRSWLTRPDSKPPS